MIRSTAAYGGCPVTKAAGKHDTLGPNDLTLAFSLFTRTSEQLAEAYHELQGQVEKLTLELAAANGELVRRERLSALGQVAAKLAHQLRTPLATAMLYVGQLAQPDVPEAERIRFAEKILLRLKHLDRLVSDMLLFVRGETLVRERVKVADLLHEAASLTEYQMRATGTGLQVAPAPDLCLEVSRKDVVGALANLLENALQSLDGEGRVELSAQQEGSQVRLAVSDTGRGIAPDALPRLFEPFYTTRPEGTGLGLAIVKNVADAHGGEVRVRSEPGRGSVFELLLPACQ
jgi:two-component system, sensor histidine kinase FlrB